MKYYYHQTIAPSMTSPEKAIFILDRSKSLFTFDNLEILTPIGELCQPKSIDQLCYERVHEILDAALGKKISIFWSGGIDSTLIVCEFLKYCPTDRIRIVLTENSIKEYPEFYEKYIHHKLETVEYNFYEDSVINQCLIDSVIVTGHLTDPMFGSNIYHIMPEFRLRQTIPEFIANLTEESQQYYTKLAAACPRELVDVKDLFWWMNYTLEYQGEQFWILLDTENLIINKNVFHFCDNKSWNDYAISTSAEEKWSGYNFVDYKMCLKKQIQGFTNDTYYTENKIKVASWRRYRKLKDRIKMPLFIDTEWKRGWRIFRG